MKKLFEQIEELVVKKITTDINKGKNFELCLNAYNYWREQECDGQMYIFNIYDKNDLKYLVKNDLVGAKDIALLVKNNNSGYFLYDNDGNMNLLNKETISNFIAFNANEIIHYAILYVGRCGENSPYSNLYDHYITEEFEKS